MKEKHELSALKRIGCFVLALVMVLGLLPATSLVRAATIADGLDAYTTYTDENNYVYGLRFRRTSPSKNIYDGEHLEVAKSSDTSAKKLYIAAFVLDETGENTKNTDAWVALYRGKFTKQSDFTDQVPMFSYRVKDKSSGNTEYNGNQVQINNKNLLLTVDNYTVVLFKDAEGTIPVQLLTFDITWPADKTEITELTPPTCTTAGSEKHVYKDAKGTGNDWVYNDVPVPALGHNISAWTQIEGTQTHTGTCSNEGCGVVTENCSFTDGVCTVCGGAEGSEEEDGPVVLTNKAGEKTDTFFVGEPIYVETNGFTSSEWLSLWYYNGGWESTYRLWWYATDEKMLLWDAVWTDGFAWDGMNMPAGTYYIYYAESDELASFTLVDPDAAVTAEKSLEFVVEDKKVSINAINYSEYSQVSITNADGAELYQFFCLGRNGLTMECELIPGEYTISMYNDYYKTDLQEQKTFTIQGEEVAILATDKTEYKFGEPIMVTSQLGDPNWLGLYKQDDTNIVSGGTVSLFWLYPTVGQPVNILSGDQQRPTEYKAGTYKVLLLDANYGVVASVENIVITAEIDESKTVKTPGTCEENGYITYTYTDNTQVTVQWDDITDEALKTELKAIGHAYPDTWTHVADTETHTRVCGNNAEHVQTANCSWDEGVESVPPTATQKGEMLYTCTICQGTKTEDIPVLSATETGRQVIAPTCTEQGYTLISYSDGSTRKVDFVPALDHDFADTYTHVNGTHTHSQECQRADCDEVKITNCELETDGVPNGDGYQYGCLKCGEWTEYIIVTNKTTYASGEDIIVSLHPNYVANMGAKDWIGLYHKGEVPNQEVNPSSIRWDYVTEFVNGKSIFTTNWHDRPAEDPDNVLKAGEYILYLCANDGYSVVTKFTITVTTEEDPSKTVQVNPTCTEDGTITYYNTDGTVSRVVTATEDANLKAHGHTFGAWTYDGVEKQTHTHVCGCTVCEEPCGFSEAMPCQWDDGVETKPATETETGIKTYTCRDCSGTKEETLPKLNVTITGTETVPATCDDPGYTRTHYSDGTYSDEVIPAKGHDYSDWTYNAATRDHSKVCANDATHVITEACDMTKTVVDNSVNYSCSICGGGYATGLVETDKTVYGVTDPIMVTVHKTYSGAWVGLYKENEKFDPDNGGIESLFWTYVTESMVGQAFDITAVVSGNNSGYRGEKLGNGKYSLVFFGDSGYTNVIDTVEIEIFTDMSNTKFDLLFYKAEVRPNGYHHRFQLKDVDNPAGGEKVTLGVNVTAGVVGSSWVGVFEGNFNLDTDFTGFTPIVQKYISDIDGKTPFSLNWKSKGGFDFYVGNFTVVIFADATTNTPVQYLTFEVYRPIVEGSEVILRQPSCDAPGLKTVDYVDDENPDTQDQGVMVIIPALGHDLGELAHIEGTNTHGKTCKRENCDYVDAEDCSSEAEGVVTKQPTATATGEKTFTCDICSSTYTEEIPMISYEGGERVFGASRYQTSIQIADALKTALGVEKFDTIVVASGLEFADALAGSYLANKKNAPILLVRNRAEDLALVKGYIHENLNPGGTVYLLGGTGAVTKAMETGLDGFNVKRLGGANRYETNLLILKEAGVTPGEDILICTGKNFADSLSASALNKPILLVKDTLTTAQTDFLRSVNGSKIYIIGGSLAVNDRISAVLSLYGQTARISGENRYETSVNIAKAFFANTKNVVLANGEDFPDGLCGGTLASSMNAPVILVANGEEKHALADEYTASNGITAGIALGGDVRITGDVMQNIFQ